MATVNFNTHAHDPAAVEATRNWLHRDAPLVCVYGPSGTGKTTLLGSLFEHPLYRRVLLIDVDNGSSTIAQYTTNKDLCERRVFDLTPDKRVGWLNKQLKEARTIECGAIVIEGFMAIHRGLVSERCESLSDTSETVLWDAHRWASARTAPLIESVRSIKLHRLANRVGVPIVVTLNTRRIPHPEIKGAHVVVPDMSPNLTDKLMSACDGFVELRRNLHGVFLRTMATSDNPFRKLRAPVPLGPKDPSRPNAATLVEQQTNLNLPGLFALWAQAEIAVYDSVVAASKSE